MPPAQSAESALTVITLPLLHGSPLRAGPTHVRNLFPDLAAVPAQNLRDLLYREAAHKQVAQLGQLRIGPFPPGIRGRRVVLNRGAVRIDDRGPQ
ncbi:MAG TPA: hypothetical protein VHT00_11750 [Stellaceae bacterium]|nr:hypothetical protein [Stellaceae bacterium]